MSDHNLSERIVVSREVLHGKARIAGTRIPVYEILDLLAGGKIITEITSDDYFPDITEADVLACVAYASQIIRDEKVIPVA